MGVDGLTPRPSRFTPEQEKKCPPYRRLGGPQGNSGQLRKISSAYRATREQGKQLTFFDVSTTPAVKQITSSHDVTTRTLRCSALLLWKLQILITKNLLLRMTIYKTLIHFHIRPTSSVQRVRWNKILIYRERDCRVADPNLPNLASSFAFYTSNVMH